MYEVNKFTFTFSHEHDRNGVLARCPWRVQNIPLIVKEYPMDIPLNELDFDSEICWV